MIIKRFKAEGFRNINSCDIEFSPKTNLLYGNNAEGKTNAVEGIYIFARGKSFRSVEEKELVGFNKEGFRIYIEYESLEGEHSLEYASFGRIKRRKKNGYPLKSVSEMLGNFRAVLFYPDNLSLVKDSPEERRAFLNIALGQAYPVYISYYSDFKKALENRNCLLKMASKGMNIEDAEIESWSLSLAKYSSYIYVERKKYIKKLEEYSKQIINEISGGKERISLIYKSNIDIETDERDLIEKEYFRLLTSDVEREKIVGSTLFGPHRDDIDIYINEKSARYFASQGQQRSIVLALKLSEGEIIRDIYGEYPVFIFDDVLSELDEKRKAYVIGASKNKQIIITGCEIDNDINADKIIYVSGGDFS